MYKNYIFSFFLYVQTAYPDGDRHLIKDSDLFQVYACLRDVHNQKHFAC